MSAGVATGAGVGVGGGVGVERLAGDGDGDGRSDGTTAMPASGGRLAATTTGSGAALPVAAAGTVRASAATDPPTINTPTRSGTTRRHRLRFRRAFGM